MVIRNVIRSKDTTLANNITPLMDGSASNAAWILARWGLGEGRGAYALQSTDYILTSTGAFRFAHHELNSVVEARETDK